MGVINKPSENVEVNNDDQDYEEHQDNIESPRKIPDTEQPMDSKGKHFNQ